MKQGQDKLYLVIFGYDQVVFYYLDCVLLSSNWISEKDTYITSLEKWPCFIQHIKCERILNVMFKVMMLREVIQKHSYMKFITIAFIHHPFAVLYKLYT